MAERGAPLATGRHHRRVRIDLAGGCSVTVDGRPVPQAELGSRRGRLLLELLVASRGRALVCDEIVEVLWPQNPPQNPEAAVATLVSRLRSVLGPRAVLGSKGVYRPGVAPDVVVDLDEAATFVAEAERRVSTEPGSASTSARRALLLLARPALEHRRYDDWAQPARDEQAALVRRARSTLTTAALDVGDPGTAIASAEAQLADDPWDEPASRQLMRAYQAAGAPGRALEVYTRLRERLATELGVDPAPETQQLYLGVLRGVDGPPSGGERAGSPEAPDVPGPAGSVLTGRQAELTHLLERWTRSASGTGDDRLTLLLGEAGIGKTRLADELVTSARRTGATVLAARCYEAERSLFLQPLVDALTPALAAMPPSAVAGLCGAEASALASVLPVVGSILDVAPDETGNEAIRRRRAFEVLDVLLKRMAADAPVLLWLDDLHNAGGSTLELLHYLVRHRAGAPYLLLAAARWEARDAVREVLGPLLDELDVGPLDRAAVHELAEGAGHGERSDDILRRTSGHTLYVVEVLAALEAQDTDLPESLRSAVLDRVRRSGSEVELVLRAASVLGASVDPAVVAAMTDLPEQQVLRACEVALEARLIAVTGRYYEFSHDLVREVLYVTTPLPTRVAQHRRAADLLAALPEAVARHAAAAHDWSRAARAGLLAAENALLALAARDAESLATNVLEWATVAGEPELRARALLVRGRAGEATSRYAQALADLEDSLAIARSAGDQRLEMLVLRQLGGDVSTALGQHVTRYGEHLDSALRLAQNLGDRVVEADLLGRMTVLHVNRLRFRDAIRCAGRATAAAEACQDPDAHVFALDAVKAAHAYLGEVDVLARTVSALEPVLRRRQDLWLLQWTVFESAFVPLAAGDHAAARALMHEALELNRRSGIVAYQSWFLAHLAWEARLVGDLGRAMELGEQSVRSADELAHPWWHPMALAVHAVTLLGAGHPRTATALLERALHQAESAGTEAYRVRCLAALAEATGSTELLRLADELVHEIDCPDGSAWLLGADAYLCTARAWLARDGDQQAAEVLRPFVVAARRCGWAPLLEQAAPVVQRLPATTLQR